MVVTRKGRQRWDNPRPGASPTTVANNPRRRRSRQAFANRKIARAGGDPLASRRRTAGVPTFAEAAEQVIAIHREAWKDGDATAQKWRAALPKRRRQIRHMPALPYAEVGAALAGVRVSQAWTGTKLAFELLVLTAARSGEVRLATWEEFDLAAAVWTVPAARPSGTLPDIGRRRQPPPAARGTLHETRRRSSNSGAKSSRLPTRPAPNNVLPQMELRRAAPSWVGIRRAAPTAKVEPDDRPRQCTEGSHNLLEIVDFTSQRQNDHERAHGEQGQHAECSSRMKSTSWPERERQ